MSVVHFSDRDLLVRVTRGFAVALAFLCIGTLVPMAFIVFIVVDSREEIHPAAGMAIVLWTLAFMTTMAGLTGLIAGLCEALFGRISARATFVISSAGASAPLTLQIVTGRMHAWNFWGTIILLLCYLTSMMACWKLIDITRGRIPAAGSLPSS